MSRVGAICCVLAIISGGCTATQETRSAAGGQSDGEGVAMAHATEAGMTCARATEVGRAALVKMGYTIASTEAAKPNAPGKVVGHKTTGWSAATPEPGQDATVYVRIKCSDRGAEFDAVTNESFLARIGFRQQFSSTISALARETTHRAGSGQQGLIIEVEPQSSHQALAQFGVDLPAVGITPVQVKLENKTQRAYGFEVEKVRLVSQEGTRVASLSLGEAAEKAGPGARAELEKKLITNGDLAPGAKRVGFLYFPSSAYSRATVTLIDRESDETEGFSVEF